MSWTASAGSAGRKPRQSPPYKLDHDRALTSALPKNHLKLAPRRSSDISGKLGHAPAAVELAYSSRASSLTLHSDDLPNFPPLPSIRTPCAARSWSVGRTVVIPDK